MNFSIKKNYLTELKLFFSIFTVLCLLSACETNTSEQISNLEPFDYFKFKKTTTLKGRELSVPSKDLSKIIRMQTLNNALVIHDYFDINYLYKLIDLRDEKVFMQFAKKGEGPNESDVPSDLQKISKSTLGFFNDKKRTFQYIDFDSLFNFRFRNVNQKNEIALDNRYFKVIKMDSFFVGTGFFDSRFALSNSKGQLMNSDIKYPFQDLLLKKNSAKVLSMAYQGDFEYASKEKAAFVVYGSPNIDFLKIVNNKIKITKSYHLRPPLFTGSEGGNETSAAFSLDNKFGFISSTSNDKFIYVLYSGKTLRDKKYDAFTASDLIVFNWEGKPINYFKLDKKVSCIGVNELGTIIYGFVDGVNPKIVSFRIP